MTFNVFGVSEAALEKGTVVPPHISALLFSPTCSLPAALNTDVISQFTLPNRGLPRKRFGREAQHLGGQKKKREGVTVIERLS